MTPAVQQQLLRGHTRRSIIALMAGGGSFIRRGSTPMLGHTVIWLRGRELLGYAWQLVAVERELHTTPAGTAQPFTWTTFRCTREGNDRPNARLNRT